MQRFLVIGVAALCLGNNARGADSYLAYHNLRYGYSVLYPSNLVTPRPESPNGDGRVFKSSDGRATLRVWGEFNVFDRNLKAQMNEARSEWGKDKGRITYWKMGEGYYVLSGLTGNDIFYEKTFPIKGCFATMLWKYPKSQKSKFDDAVAHTAHAFGESRYVSQDAPSNRAPAPRIALNAPGANSRGY